jgi:hypothetical protein
LSRWKSNKPGGNLFAQHLRTALEQALPVRLIMATAERPELVEQDLDATKIRKTYGIKPVFDTSFAKRPLLQLLVGASRA